jgi:hypothetical protein
MLELEAGGVAGGCGAALVAGAVDEVLAEPDEPVLLLVVAEPDLLTPP